MCLRKKCLDINQMLIIIFMPCTQNCHVLFSFLYALFLLFFCWRKRGGQLKGVVVKQMLFRPGIWEGLVHGSVNFSCPRFFLLLNMNDVDCFSALWWLFFTKSVLVLKGFLDWFSCCSMTLTFLCMRSLLFTIYWSIYSKDPKTKNGCITVSFL